MYTREQYLRKEVDHNTYYLYVAEKAGISIQVFPTKMVKQIQQSTDEYLNDIPLMEWDSLAVRLGLHRTLGLGAAICALKTFAKAHIHTCE